MTFIRTAAASLLALAAVAWAPSAYASAEAAGSYTVEAPTAPVVVKKGQKGSVRVAVVTKPGAHISPDAPVTISLSGGPGLELPKAKLLRADTRPTAGGGMEVDLPFVAKAAGAEQLKAGLVFFVCLRDLCERQQKSLAFQVQVE